VVCTFADGGKDPNSRFAWKAITVFSGASLQLALCMIAFGLLGRFLAGRLLAPWLTPVGVLFGMFVGLYGLFALIRQFLGGKP
jgi:hypothetical protein